MRGGRARAWSLHELAHAAVVEDLAVQRQLFHPGKVERRDIVQEVFGRHGQHLMVIMMKVLMSQLRKI